MVYYMLSDFRDISIKGFNVILPDTTIALINELSKQVGSPNYIKTPVFTKKEVSVDTEKKRRRARHRYTENSEGWNCKQSSDNNNNNIVFKPVGISKKEGIDKYIQEIRSLINKLGGGKSNESITNDLYTLIDTLLDTDVTGEDVMKLVINVINILSANIFYSDIYSSLYCCLTDKYECFSEGLSQQYSNYITTYSNIQIADPNTDYDLFCEVNKKNDLRKSHTSFYINLLGRNKIKKEDVLNNISEIMELLCNNINTDNCHIVDEVIENLFIMLSIKNNLFECCKDIQLENDVSVYDYIISLSNTKSNQYSGLGTKSLFKIKDLVDMHTNK